MTNPENALKIFEHPQFGEVRIIGRDGEPWFVAKDVAGILGYDQTSNMLKRLDDDERDKIKSSVLDDSNRSNDLSIINESGLYNAIIGSHKPEAKAFKKWITSVVLPSIRKTGGYIAGEESMDDDELIAKAMQVLQNKLRIAQLERDNAIATKSWIGSRREATAMNTASVYSRENENLRIQIGDARNWKQVKAIPWIKEEFNLRDNTAYKSNEAYSAIGKKLSKISRAMGFEIKAVPDSAYNNVNAYHMDAIESLRLELIRDLNLLRKYRRRSQDYAQGAIDGQF